MHRTAQPLVSIVTPVYNEEPRLAECIESILAQTYQNWNYTIIDNCSTDRSLEIAERYAAKDRRIRIHRNSRFLSVVASHNTAVRQISPDSKYCKVVFGDDWIYPQCLKRMVEVAEKYPSVGIVAAYQQHGQLVWMKGLPVDQELVGGREACRQFLLEKILLFGSPTSTLYRADLVRQRDPFYIETEMWPDFDVCFALLRTADLGFVHEILTFTRPQDVSVSKVASDVGAYHGTGLRLLLTYGRDCLTDQQFNECLHRYLSSYYRFLGRRFLVERDHDFWLYHRRTFEELEIRFSRTRLGLSAAGQLFRSLLNPKATWNSTKRFFTLQKIRNRNVRSVVSGFGTRSAGDREQPVVR